MGLRDDEYQLSDEVELDDGFFETVSITRDKTAPLKRGRGSQRQSIVLVSIESKLESEHYNSKKHRVNKRVKFLKMKVISSLKKEEVAQTVNQMVEGGSKIISDGSNSFNDLTKDFELVSNVVPKKNINSILPWVHKAISNAKRLLLDVHHRIDDDFLQNYLNEYCYKFNRRTFNNLFDRLMIAAVSYRWNYLGEVNG